YKLDEAFAFDLWAAPRKHPRILVLYFEARKKKPAIWVAVGGDGSESKKPSDLPTGAFHAMREAEDGTDPLLPVGPNEVGFWTRDACDVGSHTPARSISSTSSFVSSNSKTSRSSFMCSSSVVPVSGSMPMSSAN